MVTNSWEQIVNTTCPLYRISTKLKRLTRALQSRSQKHVGHIKTQLGLTREILHLLEIAQDSRVLTADENWLRCKLKRHSLVLLSLERTVARLRSCIQFLKRAMQIQRYSIAKHDFARGKIIFPKSYMRTSWQTGNYTT